MVINCAFIGFGKSTTRYHLPYVLNRKDSWHVAHIFRRHAKPEEQAPIYSHIHFTSDLDEVLNDPDVKLVVVCTTRTAISSTRNARWKPGKMCWSKNRSLRHLRRRKSCLRWRKAKG